MSFGGLVVAMAVLAACGGGGGDAGSARTENGLRAAARSATEALFAGELRTAYESFSASCREATPFSEFSSSVTIAAAFLEALSGTQMKDLEVTDVRIRNFEGDSGDVLISVTGPDGDDAFFGEEEWVRWIFEEDAWVQTDCEDIGLGGDDDDDDDNGSGGSVSNPTPAATVPPPGEGPPIGTEVEAGGSVYTVNGVEDPGPISDFNEPAEGYRYVTLDITQMAVGDEDSAGPWDFTVQDADGFLYEWTYGAKQPEFSSIQLAPGQRIRGYLTFEVPEGAELVAVYADADFPRPPVIIADLAR